MREKTIAKMSRSPRKAAASEARVTLNREEKALLDEALEQCRVAADEVQDQLTALGRWLLTHVFGGDAKAALAGDRVGRSRVWSELLRRAGGPSLRLNGKVLSSAVRIAAWDHVIQDEHWRLLDAGRKELLLPLAEAKLLREGAKHVTAMRLTQRATAAYVQATLEVLRGANATSRLTAGRITAQLRGLRERYATGAVRRRVREIVERADAEERRALEGELERVIALLREMKRDVRG